MWLKSFISYMCVGIGILPFTIGAALYEPIPMETLNNPWLWAGIIHGLLIIYLVEYYWINK